jgi:hypothetical protein
MGADHSRLRTELAPFRSVLVQRDATGHPFIIVGGQAVNIWAAYYLPREPRMQVHLPFTSKDLDLVGTKTDAQRVAAATGWNIAPLPVRGGPVEAVLSSEPAGAGLKVEFLREILGVGHDRIVTYARENLVRVPGSEEPLPVRVLDPVILLGAKIRNAVDIKQDVPENPRQDVKHVAMLALCVPHFLDDVRIHVTNPSEQRNICGKYVGILAAIKHGYTGRQFVAQHPNMIHWEGLIPVSIQRMPFEEIQTSLRHVVGRGHSRGIGI